jgi:hypothetical protein
VLNKQLTLLLLTLAEQEEHDAIAKNRKDPDAPVTWAEYRSMTFTNQVSLASTGPSFC